jgi:hypothetical protein
MLMPFAQAQETYGESDSPVAAKALDVEIRTSNPDEMAYIIRQVLLVNYVKEHHLEATKAEVEQFIAKKQQADARMLKEAEARRDKDQKALESETLTDAERTQLEGELKFIDEMLKAHQGGGDPQRAAAEAQMAKALIEQWKISQSLYRQYGGRVIYQQGGAEPLDAYHEYFKAAQKSGDFTILNKDFEPAFWAYYTNDSKHKFYPENEAEQAINTQWWLLDPQPRK